MQDCFGAILFLGTVILQLHKVFVDYNDEPVAFFAPHLRTLGYRSCLYARISHLMAPEVKIIPNCCFGESYLVYLRLDNATEIGHGAFASCRHLEEVILPKAKTIKSSAFEWCGRLVSVDIPEAESVGNAAFFECGNLETVTGSLILVGIRAFEGCIKLTTMDFSECEVIGTCAFQKTGLHRLTLRVATDIGEYAFYGSALESAYVSSRACRVGSFVFCNCVNLRKVYVDVKSIGSYAFCKCTSLKYASVLTHRSPLYPCTFEWCAKLLMLVTTAPRIAENCIQFCTKLKLCVMPYALWVGKNFLASLSTLECKIPKLDPPRDFHKSMFAVIPEEDTPTPTILRLKEEDRLKELLDSLCVSKKLIQKMPYLKKWCMTYFLPLRRFVPDEIIFVILSFIQAFEAPI